MNNEDTAGETLPRLPFPPQVIGIAGASGSGKTTLAGELAREPDGIYFPIDNYYRDLSSLPYPERIKKNFDDPDLIESSLLTAHVGALARGESIERPLYDFSTYTRVLDHTESMRAGSFVLVEGLFALYYPEFAAPLPVQDLPRHAGRRLLRAADEAGRLGARPHSRFRAPAVRDHSASFKLRLCPSLGSKCRSRDRRNRCPRLEGRAGTGYHVSARAFALTALTCKLFDHQHRQTSCHSRTKLHFRPSFTHLGYPDYG